MRHRQGHDPRARAGVRARRLGQAREPVPQLAHPLRPAKKFADAKRYDTVSYDEVLQKNLGVMDA